MTTDSLHLYSYWRSSAAYRVRIALNLKGLPYETVPVHLVHEGGEQHAPSFSALNPQELVPIVVHGNRILRQSMAIIEYLDELWPTPPLMPSTAFERHRVRAMADLIACDIHPLNNLRVQQYLENNFSVTLAQRDDWTRHWIRNGFDALEKILADESATSRYCVSESPTLADCCLVPQVYNAIRFNLDLSSYPRIIRIHEACQALSAFASARPEQQPDAPQSVKA